MGTIDRVARTAGAVAIGALYLGGFIGGLVAAVLGVIAVAFVASSAMGWCPMYAPFGFSTRKIGS
jgi:TRAP-type C4-dicarboxylate transport system permease large subunit